MSITHTARRGWDWVRASTQPHDWAEADAAALAIADVASIRHHPNAVRHVITASRQHYGGQDGVEAELARRLSRPQREAAITRARLTAARRILTDVDRGHSWQ